MSKSKFVSLFSVASLALGLTMTAGATTVSITAGPTSPSGTTTNNFDSGLLPSNYVASGSNVGVVSGTIVNVYVAPGGDSTPYAYVGSGSSILASYSSAPITSFGLYWGSADTWNTIAFTDMNGVVTTYGAGGTAVPGLALNNDTSAYVTFTDSGAAWTSVQMTSIYASFEFDNVSVLAASSSAPEPASIALLASGLVAIGVGAVRRRRSK